MSDAPLPLAAALARVDALRDEIDALRPLDDDQLGRAMQRLRLEWTYHSNAIEGNSLTYGETRALLMHGVTAHGKPLKDHLDIRRHREVIEYLEDFVRSEEPLTLHIIREMHKKLMGDTYEVTAETPDGSRVKREETSGAFKTHPNNVVTETGETHYYAKPEEVEPMMLDLVDGLRQSGEEVHPVVRAAVFHHRFVEIHPFPDGNGRTARVLMNLLLMRAGYVPAVIRRDLRQQYLRALETADSGDTQSIVTFVAGELSWAQGLFIHGIKGRADSSEFEKRLYLLQKETNIDNVNIPMQNILEHARRTFASSMRYLEPRIIKFTHLFGLIEFRGSLGHVATQSHFQSMGEMLQTLSEETWTFALARWELSASAFDRSYRIDLDLRSDLLVDHYTVAYRIAASKDGVLGPGDPMVNWESGPFERHSTENSESISNSILIETIRATEYIRDRSIGSHSL